MSVLKEPYATPSRVKGVYRYLLYSDKAKISKQELKHSISPLSLQTEEGSDYLKMVTKTINEMILMNLLEEDEEEYITLSKELPGEMKDKQTGDEYLPYYISSLFFSESNEENYDFVRLAAWYLMQDFKNAPGDQTEFLGMLEEQIGPSKLECGNGTRYGQLEDWLVFCRFAIQFSTKKVKERMVPDPTLYIQWLLPRLFSDEDTMSLTDMLSKMNENAPIFDLGYFRKELYKTYGVGDKDETMLSTVTSNALLRLSEGRIITLERRADGDVLRLKDGSEIMRYTHVTYQRKEG